MNRKTIRTMLVVAGVACFAVAALASFGWLPGDPDVNVTGVALGGFACWLGSSLP